MNTYKLTLLSLFASLAVAGRFLLQFIPNIQPATSIIIICGLVLGPLSAILLSLLVTFLSNMLLGAGIWTVWQIISWGLIGLLSGVLGKMRFKLPVSVLILFAAFSGYLYGFIISLTTYQIAGEFWPYYLAGLPFDTMHAIGNAVFMALLYPIISFSLKKYAEKHHITSNTN